MLNTRQRDACAPDSFREEVRALIGKMLEAVGDVNIGRNTVTLHGVRLHGVLSRTIILLNLYCHLVADPCIEQLLFTSTLQTCSGIHLLVDGIVLD